MGDVANIVAVIQARMGSSRLPGKVLRRVCDRPLLHILLERVRRSKLIDAVVVATTTRPEDDAIEAACAAIAVPCVRGSAEDVLDRYCQAARAFSAQSVVRICGDCPLIDPDVIDAVVDRYLQADPPYDYVANTITRTYPRGMDVEIFSRSALETAAKYARLPSEREHVTPYIYRHPNEFRMGSVQQDTDESHIRITLDTKEDLEVITLLLEELYPAHPEFSLQEISESFRRHPERLKINAHVQQKIPSFE